MKKSYDSFAVQARSLIAKLAVAKDIDKQLFYLGAFNELLKVSGWTNSEFDEETLKRVNNGWNI